MPALADLRLSLPDKDPDGWIAVSRHTFSHPDYTVGSGITPDLHHVVLAG
jgi:hypothetical protein